MSVRYLEFDSVYGKIDWINVRGGKREAGIAPWWTDDEDPTEWVRRQRSGE